MNYISYPKIKEVKVLEKYNLEILFDNGVVKRYDCTPNFKYEVFIPLRDYSFFKDVKVDQGGYGISWNDEIDMAESELWLNGVE